MAGQFGEGIQSLPLTLLHTHTTLRAHGKHKMCSELFPNDVLFICAGPFMSTAWPPPWKPSLNCLQPKLSLKIITRSWQTAAKLNATVLQNTLCSSVKQGKLFGVCVCVFWTGERVNTKPYQANPQNTMGDLAPAETSRVRWQRQWEEESIHRSGTLCSTLSGPKHTGLST